MTRFFASVLIVLTIGAATARQIESGSDTDPLAEAIKAFRRGDYLGRIERSKAGSES